jgi:hypothetical protein
MIASVYLPPRTAARSAEQVKEAYRVLLEEGALALHGCTDLCLLGDFNSKVGSMSHRHTEDAVLLAFPVLAASRHSVLSGQVNASGHLLLDVAAALGCVLLTGRGHGDDCQPSCFAPPSPMSSQPGGQSRADHILLSPALYGLDYSACVSDRVPNIEHVTLTLCLPVPCFCQSCHRSSLFCCLSVPALRAVLDPQKADTYVHELVRMREAGSFLVFEKACQEGDVDLACRLLMRMVEQAARAPGVDMTRLCHCTLRPKRSTAQLVVPWFDAE